MNKGRRKASTSDTTTSLSDAVSHVLHQEEQSPAGRISAATRAWYQANGTLEEKHTVGTFLRTADGKPTILIVYIDSNVLLHDFTTKREMYRDRLANIGFEVDEVQFKMSRYRKGQRPEGIIPHTQKGSVKPLPKLSNDEISEIQQQTKNLPPHLKETVSKAMISCKQRSMVDKSEKN